MKRAPKIPLGVLAAAALAGYAPLHAQSTTLAPPCILTGTSQTAVVPFSVAATPVWLRSASAPSVATWVVASRLGVSELRTAHGLLHVKAAEWSGLSTFQHSVWTHTANWEQRSQ